MRAQPKIAVAFGCAVAAWTPLASFIALHGTGLWRNYGWPSKAWAWWLWLPYAGSNTRCARVAESQRRWCCGRSHVRAVLRITALHQGRHRISAAAQTCSSRALG